MACSAGPDVSESGLVLALDAADLYSFTLTEVEVLVVAGGGGGGGGHGGGGGGAGGLIYNQNFAVTPGSAVTVTVGGGGNAGSNGTPGSDGSNSVFGALTATGGGGGGGENSPQSGRTGGSGGGGSGFSTASSGGAATSGQGFGGGGGGTPDTLGGSTYGHGGGGGGAGGAGTDGTEAVQPSGNVGTAGVGGPGLGFNISGTFTYYAGGGGGGYWGSNLNGGAGGLGGGGRGGDGHYAGTTDAVSGTPNTGGGGGGSPGTRFDSARTGGNGGSGIVIVRYPGPQRAIGGTVTFSGGHTIHTFTTVGSATFTPLSASNGNTILGLSDLSNTGNFGTTANSPTYSSANGGSLVFDGSNDYIETSSFIPNITNKTLSAWVKLGSTTQQGGGLIGIMGDSGEPFDSIVYNETDDGWGFGSTGFSRTAWSGVKETSTTTWVYLCATYANNDYRLYRNGLQILQTTSYSALNFNFSSKIILGKRHGSGVIGPLNASIALGSVYNRALTAAEISQNFNSLRGRFGI